MISKEKFVEYINKIKELRDIYDELNNIGERLTEFSIWNFDEESLVVDILQEVFDDKKYDWIGYFIYDLDFGEKWEEGCVTDKNGKDIPLKNACDLYDILIENVK